MKMCMSVAKMYGACAGQRPCILGAASPLSSLAWTSLRTRNGASLRREHAGQIVFRFDVPWRRAERGRPWTVFFLAAPVWTCTKRPWRPSCAALKSTAGCTTRDATGGRRPGTFWRWPTGWPLKASRTSPWNRRGVLEADLQHPGKPLHGAGGECATPEASPGAEE